MSKQAVEKGASQRERIVIIGSGWAGYNVSQQLNEKKFDITVISPWETSPYTPLLVSQPVRM